MTVLELNFGMENIQWWVCHAEKKTFKRECISSHFYTMHKCANLTMDSNSVSNFISTGRSTASYVNKMQFSWTTWQHQLQFESWVTTVNLKVSYSFVKKIMAWQVQMKLGISHSQCHPTMNLYIQPLTHNQKISVVQENQLIFCWLTNTIFKQASQT